MFKKINFKFFIIIISAIIIVLSSVYLSVIAFNDSKQRVVITTPTIVELNDEGIILSCIINAEAGCDLIDSYLIGSTVLNRLDHHSFPKCLDDVIFQNGQYDGIYGNFTRTPKSDTVASRLLRGIGRNKNVLFFYNYKIATDKSFIYWVKRKYRHITTTQNHKFYGI